MIKAMKVFLSHSSADDAEVLILAAALRERGFDVWLDKWNVGGGDDFLQHMNDALETCEASIIVFSSRSKDSPWVAAEVQYLTYARIREGKQLIPVVLDEGAFIPPLLRMLVRMRVTDVSGIASALEHRPSASPTRIPDSRAHVHRVEVHMEQTDGHGVKTRVFLDGRSYGEANLRAIPGALQSAVEEFVRNRPTEPSLGPGVSDPASERRLADLGRAIARFCLPGESGAALRDLIRIAPVGSTVEVSFQAAEPVLLGLPFEALRLPDDSLLALHPSVAILHRALELGSTAIVPSAPPLKILVAVGAPDVHERAGSALDFENEQQQSSWPRVTLNWQDLAASWRGVTSMSGSSSAS